MRDRQRSSLRPVAVRELTASVLSILERLKKFGWKRTTKQLF